jgi:hypothetical protein
MDHQRIGARRGATIVAFLLGAGVPVGSAHAQVKVLDYMGNTQQQLGSVGRAGDVDLDGSDDFIGATAWGDSDGDGKLGEVFVYSGKKGGLLYTFKSDVPGYAGFGQVVAGGGDYDGDGVPDVIVGAPRDYLGNGAGSISIYSGATGANLVRQYGFANNDDFGWSVAFLGDLDGDGYDEYAVGALNASAAYVFHGGYGSLMFTLTGQSNTSWLGASVSRLGDVNGDAIPDFLVGEPKFDAWWFFQNENGRAIACSGADGSELWEVEGSSTGDWMGLSVADLGDTDGDGVDDVVVGAPHVFGVGAAYVISGQTGGWRFPLYGDGTNDLFGWSVSGLGSDISGDGVPDFIVGAPGFDASEFSILANGYARTFSGSDGTLFDTFEGNTQYLDRNYGLSVCGGDFNGDGFGDWVIGFPGRDWSTTSTGEIEVYAGCAASWEFYGDGWPGAIKIPTVTPSGDISPGHTITLTIDDSSASATTGFFFIGLQPADIRTKYDGHLLVDLLRLVPISVPVSGLSIVGTIPNDPSLLCTNIYVQAVEADALASKGFSFTPGTRLHIGLIYP